MTYLLDTDTCIYAMKGREAVIARLLATPRSNVAVSVITAGELRVGASKSSTPRKTATRLDAFLGPLQVLDLTADDAATYATLRGRLERRGTPIGPLDAWIAAHAVSRDLTLVTNNQREFRRVRGLRLENWAA